MSPQTETGASQRGRALDGRLLTALVITFLLLFGAGTASVYMALRASDATRWVMHTLDVLQVNSRLYGSLVDAQSGQRGAALFGDQSSLARFRQASSEIGQLSGQLVTLTRDNPEQYARAAEIAELAARRVKEFEEGLTAALSQSEQERFEAVARDVASPEMERLRVLTAALEADEQRLLRARDGRLRQERVMLLTAMAASLALTALIAVVVAVLLSRQVAALRQRNRALASEMRQRAATEAQLRQSQKMEAIGRLTGGIAHDFNNMLAIVVGSLDLLLRRVGDDPRQKRLVESAIQGAQRATTFTQRLLAFSRLQPLDPKPTDINKCVGEMSELLRRSLGERVAIETVLAGGLWRGFVDCPQLESAVLNIAINARDAMPDGGKLTLETANAFLDHAYAARNEDVEPGQYVMIALTDTGTGMSPEVMNKAFEPFFTTKATGSGTGLGLSQVHGFIKQSRGHVKIYSEPGHGTTVKLYVPRYLGALPEDEGQPVAVTAAARGLTVLLVEDEAGVREFARQALEELGCTTYAAEGGERGLALLERHTDIDLLLTDVIMPGMNGRELADEARRRRPDLKVLFMTGYTQNAIVHNGMLDPGTHLLTKPFTITELERRIRAMAGERATG